MSLKQPFNPVYGSNQSLTPGAASVTVNITPGSKQLRVLNTGASPMFIRTFNSVGGTLSQAATVADCPILAGMATTITINQDHDRLSFISPSGTTAYAMLGEGF